MTSRARAEGLAAVIRDTSDVHVTTDVRNVVPPCVLVEPPTRSYVGAPGGAYEATWRIRALAPAPSNADAWDALDALVEHVVDRVDVETAEPGAWVGEPGAQPLPCYTLTVVEFVNP